MRKSRHPKKQLVNNLCEAKSRLSQRDLISLVGDNWMSRHKHTVSTDKKEADNTLQLAIRNESARPYAPVVSRFMNCPMDHHPHAQQDSKTDGVGSHFLGPAIGFQPLSFGEHQPPVTHDPVGPKHAIAPVSIADRVCIRE
jgi:hypothetical protein